MRNVYVAAVVVSLGFAGVFGAPQPSEAQGLPNPYRIAEGWAQLPNGKAMGTAGLPPADLADTGRRLKALQDELAQLEEAWLTHASAIEALTAEPQAR